MSVLKATQASNILAASGLKSSPVAIFVGGTSGIGQGMVEAFAKLTNGNAHIVIVGRNRQAAESILSSLPKPITSNSTSDSPNSKTWSHEFVQCDATLMKNVRKASQEILQQHSKINFLVQSPGIMTVGGRFETEEGIDRKMAVHYYARWKFIDELLPALAKAKEEGEDAKVMSVLGAGKGGEINLDDLGLVKTFSPTNAALQAPTYNDLMMEEFGKRNPGVTFIHSCPGFVRTNMMVNSPSRFMRLSAGIVNTVLAPFSVTKEVCAEYMWSALFQHSGGAFRTGEHGEDLKLKDYFGNEEQRLKLWEHTVKITSVSA